VGSIKEDRTVDHIYVIRQILEKCNSQKMKQHLTWKRFMTVYQENYNSKYFERQVLTN
jgi:hypothetical protein